MNFAHCLQNHAHHPCFERSEIKSQWKNRQWVSDIKINGSFHVDKILAVKLDYEAWREWDVVFKHKGLSIVEMKIRYIWLYILEWSESRGTYASIHGIYMVFWVQPKKETRSTRCMISGTPESIQWFECLQPTMDDNSNNFRVHYFFRI